jgi:hypothetical protein
MTRSLKLLAAVSAALLLATGALAFADEQTNPGTPTVQSTDSEVAAHYSEEAKQLRAKARSHRELAKQYRARSGGKVNYQQIAGHCDQLAKFYEDAAQEAEAVSSGLHK